MGRLSVIASQPPPMEPIAIVGMACRFPGAANLQEFWRLLCDGRDGTSDIPSSRWDGEAFYDEDPAAPGKSVNRRGGFIDHVDGFDWRAFRVSPREAKFMDPQHRLALEVAWEALEDAGLPLEAVAGSRTGVYLGIMWKDYLGLQSRDRSLLNGFSATGNVFAFAPGRISYTFDLRGPSVAIDCACAASLASVHAACQSLWLGEAPMALAGGVNLMLSPDANIMLSKAGVLSPEGRCKTLDADADGFVRSEGAGIVVLKPASQLASADRVYGFIRGSAMTHNGRNEWIMAASADGQQEALGEAYRVAGVDPATVDYVELHGTALKKGDPIEAKSLSAVVSAAGARKRPCLVGSVKSNIGHLDSAAGVAGLIKVALALHHRQIPPTVNLHEVNPQIPLETLGLAAQTSLGPWPERDNGRALAGVTAVSMSGVNAHLVVEGGPEPGVDIRRDDDESLRLLVLSARSPEALDDTARAFRSYPANGEAASGPALSDICYTAAVRRSHHPHRLAVAGRTSRQFVDALDDFCRRSPRDGLHSSHDMAEPAILAPDLAEAIERCRRVFVDVAAAPGEMPTDDALTLEALAYLYAAGHTIDWAALYPKGGHCVSLPPYPWQRETVWLEMSDPHATPTGGAETGAADREPRGGVGLAVSNLPADERHELLLHQVRAIVNETLGRDSTETIEDTQGLFDAGLNSIGAQELAARLQLAVDAKLPATLIFNYPTIASLATFLEMEVCGLPDDAPTLTVHQDDANHTSAADLDDLTDEQAEALLLERLRSLE